MKSFQSLLHQGISLLSVDLEVPEEVKKAFQSLLHQGISLLARLAGGNPGTGRGFNPFFIRASVYCAAPRGAPYAPRGCFNPFFIRASVYWTIAILIWRRLSDWFQSLLHQGISLLAFPRSRRRWTIEVTFQSLLHQGISLLGFGGVAGFAEAGGFNPFFIRASVYCGKVYKQGKKPPRGVSIPSSSGHQFTGRDGGAQAGEPRQFQSLLHQGISLLVFVQDGDRGRSAPWFQSLLHQGISLLDFQSLILQPVSALFQSLLHQGISLLGAGHRHVKRNGRRFNPFFIRASVY